jgi:kumamolisin
MRTSKTQQRLQNTACSVALALVATMALSPSASAGTSVAVESDAGAPHATSKLIGRTEAGRRMTIVLTLPSRDPAGAEEFVRRVGQPGDSLYHHYLTPDQYAARFGADKADYTALVAWARAHGLTPGETYTARTVLPLSGTVGAVEAALGVTFRNYVKETGEAYYEADRAATLPVEIAGKVSSIIGLTSYSHFRPLLRTLPAGMRPRPENGTGPGGALSASDLRTAYSIPPQYFAPKTQTLAVFEQGGFDASDVATYLKKMAIAAVPVTVRKVDGYSGAVNDPDIELEAVLDIDMQLAVNPAAKKIIVYEDGADSFQVALLNGLSAMAKDKAANSISISYGQDEALQGKNAITAENTVLTQLAAQGQAVFVSSGDSGAYGDTPPSLNVSDPASQPKVTAVGGTTLFTGLSARYEAELTWNDLGLGFGSTGGGISSIWKIPAYQVQFGNPVATANGGSAKYRNVPDVAAVADPLTGVAVYSAINGGWITVGGTSASAPIWASFYSIANAASEGLGFGTLGFANPTIYSLGNGLQYFYPDFNDIVDGSNGDITKFGIGGFNAGTYYDNTTGWGSFNGRGLALDIVLFAANTGTHLPPLPTGVRATAVTATSVTLQWTPKKGDTGFLVYADNYQTEAGVPPVLVTTDSATVTGLTPSTYYKMWVQPISSGGINRKTPFIYVTTSK